MRWRAWLADGSSISSDSSSWEDLPRDGVIILKIWDEDHPDRMFHGHDALWWDGSSYDVYQLDIPPPLQAIANEEADVGRLKFGVYIDSADYERIYEAALLAQE